MPIVVDTAEAPSFVRITLTGTWPTIDEQREVRQRLMAAGQLTTVTLVLIDFRQLASAVPFYTEVEKIIAAAMQDGGLPLVRAYVVGSAVQYGLVRQMMALAPSTVEIEVFTDEQEALAWIWKKEPR